MLDIAATPVTIAKGKLPAVIPAYQAGPSIGDVVRKTFEYATHVLVVDDGSTDDTGIEAERAGAEVLRQPRNRGKGCALYRAFHHLFGEGFDSVITLDADGQHLPHELPKLFGPAEAGADLVIGSRDHLFAGMSSVRRASNSWSSRLISAVAGQRLSDIQSGFRLYSRRLIEYTGFDEHRFDAESAVVVRAVRMGFRVETVPVELGFADGRLTSHYRPLVDSLRIARAVTRARLDTIGCRKIQL